MGFVTFELVLPSGDVSNVKKLRTFVPRRLEDETTWQVTVDDARVSVSGLYEGRLQVLGSGRWSGNGIRDRSGQPGYPDDRQWSLVEKALRSISAASLADDRAPTARAGSRWIMIPTHNIVGALLAVALFGGFVIAAIWQRASLGAWSLHGVHVIGAPLAALLSAAAIGRAIAGLASPAALSEPSGRDHNGKPTPGPIAGGFIAMLVVGLFLYCYPIVIVHLDRLDRPSPTMTTPTPPRPPARPPTPPAPEPIEVQIVKAPDVTAALALAKPHLGDGPDNAGARLLARYASHKLVLRDVQLAEPETTLPLVLKDSALERGKRLCTTGTLLDIERQDLDQRPTYVGALQSAEGDTVRFVAVGSTGMLVKRSTATLCGIVTGTVDKAVVVVGMFELPENQAPAVER